MGIIWAINIIEKCRILATISSHLHWFTIFRGQHQHLLQVTYGHQLALTSTRWTTRSAVSSSSASVYQLRVHDVTKLKQRLLDVWHGMEQGVSDSAIDEWRCRLLACVWAKRGHFEQKCENINNLLNSNVSTCI
jgi:hypothetical protein